MSNGIGFRIAGSVLLTLAIGGCSVTPVDTFTLKADMPADFQLKADAYYVPATGEECTAPPSKKGYVPDRKFFKSERQVTAHTAEFIVPLTEVAGGCPLVLRGLKLEMRGKWGPDRYDTSGDYASLSFRDRAPAVVNSVFNGECQWLFRTMGPYRYIVKILQCRAVDESGQVMEQGVGGVLQRNQLAGETVKMTFRVAEEGEPYYSGYWLKTDVGWKPCTGRWGTQNEEYCITPPQFIDFKMPDGRLCTVYPSCSE